MIRQPGLMLLAFLYIVAVSAQPVELSRTFSTGHVSLRYPAGWFASGHDTQLVFTNDRAALQNMDQLPEKGQVIGSLTVISDEMKEAIGIGAEDSLNDALDVILGLFSIRSLLETSNRQHFMRNDKRGIYITEGIVYRNLVADMAFIVVEETNGHSAFVVLAGEDEMAQYMETILKIAVTVEHHPNDKWATISAPLDGSQRVMVQYPSGWMATNQSDGFITFASNTQLLDDADLIPEAGQFLAQLMVLSGDAITELFAISAANDPLEIIVALLGRTRNARIRRTQQVEIQGHPGALALVTLQNDRATVETLIIVLTLDDRVAVLTLNAAPGDVSDYETVALAIMDSLVIE